ncbi:hypothetical protein SB724_20960, partial [Bacillus sp. SIMBA_031]|uniref:hypothetical protein n=1 Tax=Bacillus sp. SIMBA_031 TaxID=3085774 RepID=UPI00397B464E
MLGLLGLLIAAAVLESGKPTPELYLLLMESGVSLTLTVGAVMGSFSFTSDYKKGSFSRRVLLFQ